MNPPEEYIRYLKRTAEKIESREVNLTNDQVKQIETLAREAGVKFNDMVMMLLAVQLTEMRAEYLQQLGRSN